MLVAPITGNLRAISHPGDHPLRERRAAGLRGPSPAQTKIATIETSMIGRRLGTLARAVLTALENGLREALAFYKG